MVSSCAISVHSSTTLNVASLDEAGTSEANVKNSELTSFE